MTHFAPPQTAAKTPNNTRWTADKAAAFLQLLAVDGNTAKAARMVGMSRNAVYMLAARAPEFAHLFALARGSGRERVRARRRVPRPVHPLLARSPLEGRAG